MKPTVAGMAMALNGHEQTVRLWAITHDATAEVVRGNYSTLPPERD